EAGARVSLKVSSQDIRSAADASNSHSPLARVFLQPSDQFRQILCRQNLSWNDPHRTVGHQRYRFEILHHIVLKPVGGTIDRMRLPLSDLAHLAIPPP